jgi:hypothetical protein
MDDYQGRIYESDSLLAEPSYGRNRPNMVSYMPTQDCSSLNVCTSRTVDIRIFRRSPDIVLRILSRFAVYMYSLTVVDVASSQQF